MRLTFKLTLALLLVVCAALAVYARVQAQREIAFYEKATERDHRLFGRALALAVRKHWATEGEAATLDFVRSMHEQAGPVDVRWVWLEPAAGAPFEAHLPRDVLAPVTAGADVARVDTAAGRLYTYVPVAIPGRGMGALELAESLDEQRLYTRATIVRLIATMAAIAALSAAVAFVLGAWLVGRPIGRLVAVARRIGSGDLASRVVFGQRDELAALAHEMNTMADRLAVALEQLRRADRLATVGTLASGVAHELGTPLNVILLRAKRAAAGDGEDGPESARVIVEQSERMTRIIRQLLDFARPRKPVRAPADVRALARGALAMLEPLAKKRGVSLAVENGAAPATASVDAGQLQQVLTNLAMNGMQAMPRGGALTVSVGAVRARPPAPAEAAEDDYVRIDVRDEGDGIPAENLPRLFEPFFTTKEVGEGTGLGLPVSHGIVREHGGWIAVSTELGRGSCFSVFLPQGERACVAAS
jgi:signal transduction histidine kinase